MGNWQKFLGDHWPAIAAAITAAAPFALPVMNSYIAAHPHTALAALLAGIVAAYYATAPKDKPLQPPEGPGGPAPTATNSAAKVMILVACMLLPSVVHSQAAPVPAPAPLTNLYAGGISYNNQGTPGIAGTGLYARLVDSGSGTYAFTVVDALPTQYKPFTVVSNVGVGIAQKVFSLGKIPIFIPTSAGISWSGQNTGWQWNTGVMASVKLKGNWRLLPHVRVLKSSVSNGTSYQPIVGVMVGWGK